MYIAEHNQIFLNDGSGILFLTVHPTENHNRTPQEIASIIAHMLNSDASLRYRITGDA